MLANAAVFVVALHKNYEIRNGISGGGDLLHRTSEYMAAETSKSTAPVHVVPRSAWEEDERDDELRHEARALAEDDMNREIIKRLQDDGRMSFSRIARELGTSEATIRNRVSRMIETRLMRVIAVVDPVSLGRTSYAMVGLTVAPGSDPRRVGKVFADCDEVTYVLFAAGKFDLMVEVICEEAEAFRNFLLDRCYNNPEIASVEPMMGLQLLKSLMKWGRP